MAIRKPKPALAILAAVLTIIQALFVMPINVMLLVLLYRYFEPLNLSSSIFGDAVVRILAIDKREALTGWLIVQLIIHTIWCASAILIFVHSIKVKSAKSEHYIPWMESTIFALLVDTGAATHITIAVKPFENGIQAVCPPDLFFLLYFTKCGILWIANAILFGIVIAFVFKPLRKQEHPIPKSRRKRWRELVTSWHWSPRFLSDDAVFNLGGQNTQQRLPRVIDEDWKDYVMPRSEYSEEPRSASVMAQANSVYYQSRSTTPVNVNREHSYWDSYHN